MSVSQRAGGHLASTSPTLTGGGPVGTEARLLEDLTPSQRRAVIAPAPTVCVMAAAGAGKTRVLTRRVAYRVATGSARADHVLAITFTRKAAGELRERLAGLGLPQPVTAGTFHSVAMAQLRRWWADRHVPEPVLLERKGRLLAELSAERAALSGANLADLAGHIEWAKARLVGPESFVAAATQARREVGCEAEAVAALYARYEDEKRRRRLVDFDDLLVRFADALASDQRFADAQRWRWQHVLVDELQDVNPLQCRLLTGLLGDNEDLFVVGDPNQAIYGWNGADPSFLSDFPLRWPRAEVVRLDDNHRSSPQVVAAATAVLGRQAVEVRSSRPDGPLPALRSYPSEDSEAAGVASEVLDAHAKGLGWSSMAVLARTNAQLEVLGRTLDRAGVPFRALASADDDKAAGALEAGNGPQLPGGGSNGWSVTSLGPEGRDQVTLCSFHRSKGLQWQAVWLCGLEAGLVPIAYASTSATLAEERRLLYVAMTRAERSLRCSWARSRRASNGASLWREPSPWLSALARHCQGTEGRAGDDTGGEDAVTRANGGESAGDRGAAGEGATMIDFFSSARRRLKKARAVHPLASDQSGQRVESPVTQQLQEWRRRLARASGVPPYVLLHDATLAEIAERRPATAEELLAVPGMGPVKVSRFGPAILEVVRSATGGGSTPVRAGA